MSSVNSIGASAATYQPAANVAAQNKQAVAPKTAASAPAADHDHDGDADGAGIDVKG